jgi:histidine ammonia-lyase
MGDYAKGRCMSEVFMIHEGPLSLESVQALAFRLSGDQSDDITIEISESVTERVRKSQAHLMSLLEKRIPIYGVTTGFGDSCHRFVSPAKSEELQSNLVAYLSCGSGALLPKSASRAMMFIRLKSLSRGFSGVSFELLERIRIFLENDWIPAVPCEGSLGASGDLIPLAYLARALQGEGQIHDPSGIRQISAGEVLARAGIAPYRLKPKEGLALINGTSAMAGLCAVNLAHAGFLARMSATASAWMCLALQGKIEAFGELVNERANVHPGQARAARAIRELLNDESYQPLRGQDVQIQGAVTAGLVQDRYSLRCSPQILGPVFETVDLVSSWVEREINGTSDNPLIDEDGSLAMGGNFYGGYLSQGMDYLKISLAHVADLMDRQLTMLCDEKSNRGLTPNLVDWASLPEEDRFLHHGLKGLHQAVNAITSEILARSNPNGVFSRSSESHNQDKVSLGMSAAVRCSEMIEPMFTTMAMHLTCLAQALEMRGVKLRGERSREIFDLVRSEIPYIRRDTALGEMIQKLALRLKEMAFIKERPNEEA